ncbi:MAG: hypothetical protein Q7O66_15760 [Dehalococcoidia bacterium]|nr:hypothetical protein [Dehalococcoidia bacterium]
MNLLLRSLGQGIRSAKAKIYGQFLVFVSVFAMALYLFIGSGCSPLFGDGCSILLAYLSPHVSGPEIQTRVGPAVADNAMGVYADIAMTGVYSPAMTSRSSGWFSPSPSADVQPVPDFLNELADNGYFAMRVPELAGQASQVVSMSVTLNYYSPPLTSTVTSVPITFTRWVTYEAAVTSQFGTDGQSHWEVWRIPPGDSLPIPNSTFAFKDEFPTALSIHYFMYFGAGANSANAFGRSVGYALYNGYTFIGPIESALNAEVWPLPANNPLVGFGAWCSFDGLQSPSIVQEISANVPFTHTLCLQNYDAVTRTFTITASSPQAWDYKYYYRTQTQIIPTAGLPFTVATGPADASFPYAGLANVFAVYTPTLSTGDTIRETLTLTATSTVSPTVRASGASVAIGQGYRPNEEGGYKIYLPVVLKNY